MADEQPLPLTADQREIAEKVEKLKMLQATEQIHELFTERVQERADGLDVLRGQNLNINPDDRLTLAEFLKNKTLLAAMEKDIEERNHQPPDSVLVKPGSLDAKAEASKADKAFITATKETFNIMQQSLPDNNPTDEEIVIPEVAKRERKFLKETFSTEVMNLNQPGADPAVKAAYDLINKLAGPDQEKGTER